MKRKDSVASMKPINDFLDQKKTDPEEKNAKQSSSEQQKALLQCQGAIKMPYGPL